MGLVCFALLVVLKAEHQTSLSLQCDDIICCFKFHACRFLNLTCVSLCQSLLSSSFCCFDFKKIVFFWVHLVTPLTTPCPYKDRKVEDDVMGLLLITLLFMILHLLN
ncbi:hypothetical protein Peur_032909 [Populus x canadensis]